MAEPTLRVMTQNLWGRYFAIDAPGIGYAPHGDPPPAWHARIAVLRDGIRRLRPDVLAVQEAILTDSSDLLADLVGPGYQVVHQRMREPDGAGVSIASRWPVEAVHEVDLCLTDRVEPTRVTLVAEIAAPEPFGRIVVADHAPSWELDQERERELQAVAVARALEAHTGHVVVAGDFNVALPAASMRFWAGYQSLDGFSVSYADAWTEAHPDAPGHTFTPANPLIAEGTWPQQRGETKDHILVRRVGHGPTLDVAACALAFDKPVDGVWASDHFGVVADLVPPPPTPRPTRV